MPRGRFRFVELGDPKWGRIIVRDPSTSGDEVLDVTLEFAIAHQGRLPPAVIWRLSKYQHLTVYNRLARHGMVRYEPRKFLGGVVVVDRWPVQESIATVWLDGADWLAAGESVAWVTTAGAG